MAVTVTPQDVHSVTITAPTGTAVNITDLAQAIDATWPLSNNFLVIQHDPENSASTFVYLGDSAVTNARMGAKLRVGDSITFGTDKMSRVRTTGMFILGSTSGLKVNLFSVEGHR